MKQIPSFLMESALQTFNRGRDALGPGSRLERAIRSGWRASRPRAARSAVPLRGCCPVGKTGVRCTFAPQRAGVEAFNEQLEAVYQAARCSSGIGRAPF